MRKYSAGAIRHFECMQTERETASRAVEMAREAGFQPLGEKQALHPGDKVFTLYKNKAAALFVIGQKSLKTGMRLLCAHTDAPRLDLRPCPLYEKKDWECFAPIITAV